MTIQDWASLIVAILTILSSIAFGIKWLVKHYLAELKTNGGSSMRDEIKSIKDRQDEADVVRREMDRKLDKMYSILIEYIAKN